MNGFILREARAVLVWSLLSCTLRLFLSLLDELSSLQDDLLLSSTTVVVGGEQSSDHQQYFCFAPSPHVQCWKSGTITREFLTLLSLLAGWLLRILPSIKSSVGFSFASTWILYPIRDKFGSIPNLSCRICETIMGRISLRQLAMIFPIHFLVPTSGVWALKKLLLPEVLASYAIEPISYSESNPWIMDFLSEILVNTFFIVGLLVIPELLQINGIKRGFALMVLYPLYSFSVDADSNGSVFSPNTLYALRYVNKQDEVPFAQWSHLLGPIVSGIISGRIMKNAFPDEK